MIETERDKKNVGYFLYFTYRNFLDSYSWILTRKRSSWWIVALENYPKVSLAQDFTRSIAGHGISFEALKQVLDELVMGNRPKVTSFVKIDIFRQTLFRFVRQNCV